MAKYTSGRQKNLKVGINSYSENLTSLEVIGKVGIGTTNAQSNLYVVGDGKFTGIVTAAYFYGDGSGLTNLPGGLGAGYASTAGIATYATNAGVATYSSRAGIATYAPNAGVSTYATSAGIATYAPNAGVSTYATSSGISTYASTAGIATYATSAGIATYAPNAGVSTYATSAGIATYAPNAGVSTYATSAGIATIAGYASTAGIATYAPNAGVATYAPNAGVSTYASSAGIATYASNAGVSTYARTSGISTYASTAGIATYATTAGVATALQNARTISLTGDVAGSISFDGSTNVSIAATIQPDSVGLGTDTFGDYVRNISGTSNQITVTGGTGESSTPVIALASNPTIPGNTTIAGTLQVNSNLNVNGNITLGGTSAYILVNDFRVKDGDIVLGFTTDSSNNDASNDTTANHGGVAVASTEGTPLVNLTIAGIETTPATYKKIMWFKSGSFAGLNTDAWLTNYAIGIGSTQVPNGVRFASGAVQFTERDLISVGNINASGIVTATTFVGVFSGNASSATYAPNAGVATYAPNAGVATYAPNAGVATYAPTAGIATYAPNAGVATYASTAGIATYAPNAGVSTYASTAGIATIAGYASTAGIATYAPNAGVSTSVIGGIASVTQLSVSGVSTVGLLTATIIGIGTTNPTSSLWVNGNGYFVGVLTANRIVSSIYGEFTGGGISGTNIVGTALSISGISTLGTVQISSGIVTATSGVVTYYGDGSKLSNIVTPGSSASFSNLVGTALSISGISTLGTVQVSSGIVTATSGVVTYYGDGSKLTGITATSNLSIQVSTSSNPQYLTYVGSATTNQIGISTANLFNLTFLPSSGYLGIGITTPLYAADIANGDLRIQSTNKMRFGGTSSPTNFYIQYNSTTNSLDFVAG